MADPDARGEPDSTPASSGNPPARASATIARSAASAGAATITSRILGLVREQVLARTFGASDAMDAYFTAFRIPNLLRDLFAEGAMSAAFVPTFTKHLTTEGKDSAFRLGNNVINALLVVTAALVALGIVFAEPLVTAYAGDFSKVPGKLELTMQLARIMIPVLTFIALAAALMGMLNALHHFFIPALSPAMFNVVTIVTALGVVPFASALGVQPITLIAISTLLGGIAQLALQWPSLRGEGFSYRPVLDWRDPGLRRILILMGPGTLGLAATQVNIFVNTVLATKEGTGAVSWLTYAFRVMYLPIGLFGVSIATAVLPAVSRHTARHDEDAARDTIADGMSLMMMLNIPATVGLAVLAAPIIRLLFERGRFGPADTTATAIALQLYAVGLVGYSVVRLASPVFYALGLNRTPVKVSIITVAMNATLNYVLARQVGLGYAGLALGTSLAALFNGVTLLVLLRRRLHGLHDARLLASLTRIVMAAAAMGAAAWGLNRELEVLLPGRALVVQLVRLAVAVGGALAVLALAAHLLHIREFREGVALVTRRVRRRAS